MVYETGASVYNKSMKHLLQFLDHNRISYAQNAPMSRYTTFQTGGPADLIVFPDSRERLILCLNELRRQNIPAVVIGNGSNLLVRDGGIRGAVVSLSSLNRLCVQGTSLFAEAGVKLSKACAFALSHGLTGLEFAGGIPGSVGGGVFMNAGAYGGELAQVIKAVTLLDDQGNVLTIPVEEMRFGYRHSLCMEQGYIVAECEFALEQGDVEQARRRLKELNDRRREKQPLEYPSAGSTFKRPEGHFAGALIESAGLKGVSVGGAAVSQKHAGFVVNQNHATAGDIIRLIRLVQKTVLEKHGVELVPEVRIIGEDLPCV